MKKVTIYRCAIIFFMLGLNHLTNAQGFGVGVPSPTAALHIQAGTAAVGTAPLKFTSGVNLTAPESGAVEYDGTRLYFTTSTPTRISLLGHNFGLAGGTTLIGGTAASEALTLSSTSHATKGKILFGTSGYDEVNNRFGIGTATPTAVLHLKAGTAAAGTAPVKFTSGANLTTPEAGAMEWDGTNLFVTQTSGPTRKTIAYTSDYTFSTGLTNTAGTITDNLATGKAGSQSVVGGTAASETLTLSSTTHATKGKILVGTSGYDEVSNRFGIGTATPTAALHLKAGTAAASTAPLKFTAGTNLTTPEAGALEWDGTNLFITQASGPTRKTIALTTDYPVSTGLTNTAGVITSNLSTGVAGGQSVIGGTASGNNLTLSSTSHATKGKILFGTSGYDEVNNRLGIGTNAPSNPLTVADNNAAISLAGAHLILENSTGSQTAMYYSFAGAQAASIRCDPSNMVLNCTGGNFWLNQDFGTSTVNLRAGGGTIHLSFNATNITTATALVRENSASAINATTTATAAQIGGGLITSTSAALTTITLPTATLLATQLGASRGTIFEFVVDNTAGAKVVTIAVGAGITLTGSAAPFNVLTVPFGATGVATFKLVFSSATAAVLSRAS